MHDKINHGIIRTRMLRIENFSFNCFAFVQLDQIVIEHSFFVFLVQSFPSLCGILVMQIFLFS
jgi:hypothetical protein